MHTFLIATTILFLQQAASVESPQRREIDLHVTMIGLDASVSVPDEIDDPGAFVAGLRGKPGVRWCERFHFSALDKGAAKFTSGSDQAMISGYTYGLNVGQSRGTASPMNPAAEGAAPPGGDAPRPRGPEGAIPNLTIQTFGTSVILQPAIQADGQVLIEAKLSSSRLEDLAGADKAAESILIPTSVSRTFSVSTTILSASGESVLLRTSESDVTGKAPGQTVLVVITPVVK